MMSVLFTFFYAVCFIYMLRRRFDLFTLTFLTSTVYFSPAFFGITHDGTLPLIKNEIVFWQYLFYFYYFALLLSFSWLFTATNASLVKIADAKNQSLAAGDIRVLTGMSQTSGVLAPILLLLAWSVMGQALFAADKKIVLENFSIFYALFETVALIYFFTSFICKSKFHIVASSLLIVFDLFIGFRAVGAFALILAFTYSLFLKPSAKNSLIFGFVLIAGYTVASLYKIITLALKYGEAAGSFLALQNFDSVMESLLVTESFTTQEVFGKTISSNLAVPLEYPLEVIRILLPGVNNMLLGKGLGFNDYYQDKLFPHIPWGLGSNVWAEQYAIWGWAGPLVLTFILFLLLFYLNGRIFKWYSRGQVYYLSITLFTVAPFYFYIHRNDFLFQLNITRNYLVVWFFIYWIVKYISPEFRKHLRCRV